MGKRLSFYKINPPYSHLKEVVFERFDDFRKWYLEYPNEININILKYIENDNLFKINFDMLDQQIVDEIVSCFLGLFDDSENIFFKPFGPDVHPKKFTSSTNLVLETKDTTLIGLWKILFNGRSLKDGKYFNGYNNDFKIGFLSNIECDQFKEIMAKYFINIEYVKNNFKEEEGLGIVLLLTVLNEIMGYEGELIISIG